MSNTYFYLTLTNESVICQQSELDDEQVFRAILLILSRFKKESDLKMACQWMLESESCSREEFEQKVLEFKHFIHDYEESELLLEFEAEKINIKARMKVMGMFCAVAYLYTGFSEGSVIKRNFHQDLITNGSEKIKAHLMKKGLMSKEFTTTMVC